MVSFPLAIVLGIGLVLSLRGKGTAWCAFLALSLGIVISGTQIGRAFINVINAALAAVGAGGAAIGV